MAQSYGQLKHIVNEFPSQARRLVHEYTEACDVGDLDAMREVVRKLAKASVEVEAVTSRMLEMGQDVK